MRKRGVRRGIGLKPWLVVSMLIPALSTGFIEYSAAETRWISIDQLNGVLQENNLVIVDLRTPTEFEQGHLAGSINVPVADLASGPSLLDAYRDRPILLYCRTVNRTKRALSILEPRGFKSIYALTGGYELFKSSQKDKEGGRP